MSELPNPATDWVCLDVETGGTEPEYYLQPWRVAEQKAWIRTYALSWVSDGKIKHTATHEIDRYRMSQMLLRIAESGKTIVTWKGIFDISWFIGYGLIEECRRCKWLDAMVLWKNLDRNRRTYGLKSAVAEFLPQHAGYEDSVDFENISDKDLAVYNTQDTDFTLYLAMKFWSELTERERHALLVDFEDMVAIAERNVAGLPVSVENLRDISQTLNKQRRENYLKLLPHLETLDSAMGRGVKFTPAELRKRFPDWSTGGLKEYGRESAINLDSDKQLQQLLFEKWELPVHKMTKGGAKSVDKESLLELSHIDERAKWVQQYRETTGLISKCVKAVVESVKYNNPNPGYEYVPIVRPELKKSGTVTDRCTYSSNQKGGKKRVKDV